MLSDDPMGSSLLVKQAAAPFTIDVQTPPILVKQAAESFTIGVQAQLSTRNLSLVEAVQWRPVKQVDNGSKGNDGLMQIKMTSQYRCAMQKCTWWKFLKTE
jgi:hypothetical protein